MGRKKSIFLLLAYPLLVLLPLPATMFIYKNPADHLSPSELSDRFYFMMSFLLTRRLFPKALTIIREDR